jgi:hypothetical protein
MAGGRPTKLTTEVRKDLIARLAEGAPISACCAVVGIDDSTFRKWRTLARNGDAAMAEFFTEVARARAEGELKLWGIATAGDPMATSNGPAKCAQWALERQFGTKYAPRVSVKVEEELETLLDVVERICESKDCGCYEAVLEAVAARARGEEVGGPEGSPGSSPQSEGEVVH